MIQCIIWYSGYTTKTLTPSPHSPVTAFLEFALSLVAVFFKMDKLGFSFQFQLENIQLRVCCGFRLSICGAEICQLPTNLLGDIQVFAIPCQNHFKCSALALMLKPSKASYPRDQAALMKS